MILGKNVKFIKRISNLNDYKRTQSFITRLCLPVALIIIVNNTHAMRIELDVMIKM